MPTILLKLSVKATVDPDVDRTDRIPSAEVKGEVIDQVITFLESDCEIEGWNIECEEL